MPLAGLNRGLLGIVSLHGAVALEMVSALGGRMPPLGRLVELVEVELLFLGVSAS